MARPNRCSRPGRWHQPPGSGRPADAESEGPAGQPALLRGRVDDREGGLPLTSGPAFWPAYCLDVGRSENSPLDTGGPRRHLP